MAIERVVDGHRIVTGNPGFYTACPGTDGI